MKGKWDGMPREEILLARKMKFPPKPTHLKCTQKSRVSLDEAATYVASAFGFKRADIGNYKTKKPKPVGLKR
jgi:hypothetical protein